MDRIHRVFPSSCPSAPCPSPGEFCFADDALFISQTIGSVAESHPSRIRRGYGVPARAAQPPPANAAAAANRDQAAALDPGDVRQPDGGDAAAQLGRLLHGRDKRQETKRAIVFELLWPCHGSHPFSLPLLGPLLNHEK